MTLGTNSISGTLAIWLCNGIAMSMILARLWLRSWSRIAHTRGDGWLVVAFLFTGLRVVGDCYMNKYGTPLSVSVHDIIAPVAAGESPGHEMTAEERSGLVLAGRLMIATRIAIVVILWSLKMSALDTLNTLLRKLRCEPLVLWFISAVLGLTFFASISSVFLECQKLELNWVLFPDAEKCSYGAVWIIIYEISNIMTDAMLFSLPIFLILGAPTLEWEPAWLAVFGLSATLVFGLDAALVAVEITRLLEGLLFTDMLLNRIVWGSVEVAIATSINTLPTIYTLIRMASEKRHQKEEGTQRDAGEIPATSNATGERTHENSPPQHQDPLDDNLVPRDNKPISTETGEERGTRKPTLWNSTQSSIIGSILGSVLPKARNRDSWPKPGSIFRNSFRGSGTCSRLSSRMRGVDDSLYETQVGWIELEGANDGSVVGEASSPEPDDAEYRSGEVFVATEINQEAHQEWELDQRPRIITIPRRVKLDGPEV